MAEEHPTYQRLPGSGGGGFQRCRLWLGPDHLLQVASTPVGERYKRFYFADIQALILRRSRSGLWWGIVWLAITALHGVPVFFGVEPEGLIFLGTSGGICLLIALLVLIRGRSCFCTIRTAVQTEELPSLRRLGTARKVLVRLRPLIEAAQTTATPAGVAAATFDSP
jgi:hypothetical protein